MFIKAIAIALMNPGCPRCVAACFHPYCKGIKFDKIKLAGDGTPAMGNKGRIDCISFLIFEKKWLVKEYQSWEEKINGC